MENATSRGPAGNPAETTSASLVFDRVPPVEPRIELTPNALKVLERRYLKKGENGKVDEKPEDMFWRVACNIATADACFEPDADVRETARRFYKLMGSLSFLPNSPTLMNAGRDLQQLSACFVLPVGDSMEEIFETLKHTALIHKSGGGTGFAFSRLRPKNDIVQSTHGVSSGPVSFMRIFDAATEHVKQGGCFGPNERISTDKGLIHARKLADYIDGGDTFYAHTHQGLRQIIARFRNGVKQLYEVTTKRGYKVSVTAAHKVAILVNGQVTTVPLKYLKSGDEILLLLGSGIETDYVPLREVVYERSVMSTQLNEEVTFPLALTEELAYLIGYMYGDGSVHWGKKVNWTAPKAIKLATAEAYPDIRNRLIRIIRQLFGLEPSVTQGDGAVIEVSLYSRLVVEWLKVNGLLKDKADHIRVPEIIFRSPSNVMGAFIAGYFDADGCDRGKKGSFGIDSISRGMLEDVQQLLAANGILSHITQQDRSAEGWRTIYRLIVTGAQFKRRFADFVAAEKVGDTEAKRDAYNTYPAAVLKSAGARSKHYDGIYDYTSERVSFNQMSKIHARLVECNDLDVAENIANLMNMVPDEIVSITAGEHSEVYDFEVAGVHLLSGNGVYTSNSRRGANMGILRVDHPDILEFIECKVENNAIQNFNISVAITEKFMQAVERGADYDLVNPRNGKVTGSLNAKEIFDKLTEMAWRSGDPGIVFIDRINRDNPTPQVGEMESTNPCGEQPLLPYESCNLGSLNLNYVINNGEVNWEKLAEIVHDGVHFLDNVIEMNHYPLPQIDEITKANRKIGLGVMGFADALIQLGISYNSQRAVDTAEEIMRFIQNESKKASAKLAEVRGEFPNFQGSIYDRPGAVKLRNSTTTTVAPTGTISMIAGASSGVEPLFALAYVKNVMDNTALVEVNPVFEDTAKRQGFHYDELMQKVAEHGSAKGVDGVPEEYQRLFVTSHDILPEWHARIQAAFQKYTDNAVSKTVNFANDATVEDVREVYTLAYQLGCKGVTIYRDGSKDKQVLYTGTQDPNAKQVQETVIPEPDFRLHLKPRPRPEMTTGQTLKIGTGCGNLYVTINEDEHGPCEVFSQMGKTGGCASAQSEAVSRLASLAFRAGVEPAEVVDQLSGIRCPLPSWQKNGMVLSCPDGISKVLKKYLGENGNGDDTTKKAGGRGDIVGMCPDCGHVLEFLEGCAVCKSCGYSKCG